MNRFDLLMRLHKESELWRAKLGQVQSGNKHQEDDPVTEMTTPFNFKIKGPTSNLIYYSPQRFFFFGGPWPAYESFLIMALTRHGGTFLDIGANVGYYSLLAAANAARPLSVHAFEPSAFTYDFLVENIRLNGFQRRITPYHLGVGRERGDATLHVAGFFSSFDAETVEGRPTGGAHHTETAQIAPLNDLFHPSHLKAPVVLKIDTEGFELQVLQGGERLIRNPVTFALIVETASPKEHPESGDIFNALDEWGFDRLGLIQSSAKNQYAEDNRLVPFEDVPQDDPESWPHYWLCIRRDHPMRDFIDQAADLYKYHWAARFLTNHELEDHVQKMESARDSL